MAIQQIGCGAGDKDFAEQANILRLIVGKADAGLETDRICVLETNLDDVSGEVIGHCVERLGDVADLVGANHRHSGTQVSPSDRIDALVEQGERFELALEEPEGGTNDRADG